MTKIICMARTYTLLLNLWVLSCSFFKIRFCTKCFGSIITAFNQKNQRISSKMHCHFIGGFPSSVQSFRKYSIFTKTGRAILDSPISAIIRTSCSRSAKSSPVCSTQWEIIYRIYLVIKKLLNKYHICIVLLKTHSGFSSMENS